MRDVVVELAGVSGMFEAPPGDPEAPGFAFASGVERVLAAAGTLTAAERRAARLVDRLMVGVAINIGKEPPFSLDERVE
ncbi:MAG TPA: hypothetical protein PK452_18065, partial [Amaricoccus sp.]|nr:hypothetical protein [Amaricoccus sp.]